MRIALARGANCTIVWFSPLIMDESIVRTAPLCDHGATYGNHTMDNCTGTDHGTVL